MDKIQYRDELLNDFRTQITYQVSEYVHHDDAGCGKLDADPFFQADHQSHGHGQYGKKQFILEAENSEAYRRYRMQDCENMDDPRCLDVT